MSFSAHWKDLLASTRDPSSWGDADRRLAEVFYNWGALDTLNGASVKLQIDSQPEPEALCPHGLSHGRCVTCEKACYAFSKGL